MVEGRYAATDRAFRLAVDPQTVIKELVEKSDKMGSFCYTLGHCYDAIKLKNVERANGWLSLAKTRYDSAKSYCFESENDAMKVTLDNLVNDIEVLKNGT